MISSCLIIIIIIHLISTISSNFTNEVMAKVTAEEVVTQVAVEEVAVEEVAVEEVAVEEVVTEVAVEEVASICLSYLIDKY